MTASKKDDIGKWFEGFVRDALVEAQTKKLCRFLRLYDSHAAGNYLPESAGDFVVASDQGGWLVECKATAKHKTLRSCLAANVKLNQAAHLKLWARFQPAYVWFFSEVEDVVEVWDGEDVGKARSEGNRLDTEKRLALIPAKDFGQWLEVVLDS